MNNLRCPQCGLSHIKRMSVLELHACCFNHHPKSPVIKNVGQVSLP